MPLTAYLKILRERWKVVAATTLIIALLALAYSLRTTPVYSASTRLFVSTPANSLNEAYNGNLFSQQRVASYAQLIMGTNLAQRTIDHNGFDMSAQDLAGKVTATSSPDDVLIEVTVQDTSAEQAAILANALSDEFVTMVSDLEIPPWQPPNASYVHVVIDEPATVPGSPITPRPKRNVALGIGAGLLLGIALAALRHQSDTRIRSRRAAEESSELPVLATLPVSEGRASHVVPLDPSASSGVAYKSLMTRVLLSSNNPPKVITVTSPAPGAGTTTTVINLARSFAEAKLSVAVVDGNLQKPAVADRLGIRSDSGLSNILNGQADLAEVLQTTPLEGLSALTAGTAMSATASELIGSSRFSGVIDDLRNKFDHVLIDGGALSSGSDPQVLAHESDGVLIVVRLKATKEADLRSTVQQLYAVGAQPIGVILQTVPKSGRLLAYLRARRSRHRGRAPQLSGVVSEFPRRNHRMHE
jgi:succinoglycan biosynthesis transport protein ExoP